MEESISYLENLRKKAVRLIVIITLFAVIPSILCLILSTSHGFGQVGVYLSIILGIGIWYLLGKITGYFKVFEDFKARFKATFVEAPFREAFSGVIYNRDRGLAEYRIEDTGIMSMGNRYNSNDYIKGYYKDVSFERADVKIEQHYSTGKSSYTVTYLQGRWLIFEFPKDFHFELQIISDKFPNPKKKNSIFTEEEERRHRIELEDIAFHDKFNVFCQNEHEAYYILTPQLMSVLKEMYDTLDGSFMLGFINNKLHIAIHNKKDAMEPKLFDTIDFAAVKEEVLYEIKIIKDIIDSLKLNEYIFKLKEERL